MKGLNVFIYNGAPSVIMRFQGINDEIESLTIDEVDLEIKTMNAN